MTTLQQFLDLPTLPNAWISFKQMEVYVRRSKRRVNGAMVRVFDLANMSASEETSGKGSLWELVEQLKTLKGFDGLYVENVLNPRLEKSLLSRGWEQVTFNDNWPNCFFLKI